MVYTIGVGVGVGRLVGVTTIDVRTGNVALGVGLTNGVKIILGDSVGWIVGGALPQLLNRIKKALTINHAANANLPLKNIAEIITQPP
jgi:hypothetical protein